MSGHSVENSMEIRLDRRSVRQLRLAATDAIEEGDTEALREEIINTFTAEQVEELERRIDSPDIYEFFSEVVDEWISEDVDELFDLIEGQLADAGVDLKYDAQDMDDDDDDDEEEEEEEEEEFSLEDADEEL